ncbi:MAG: ATP-dependent Clp protease ATP-binding subunit, partial [Blastocatellia bacterium]
AIERYLIIPLSNLIATEQISAGDVLLVERDEMEDELRFSKAHGMAAAVNGGPQRGAFPQPRALGL